MTVPEALEKISKALAVLTHQTRAENLAGLFSKNRLTEDLLLPVFRLALKAPHLRNVNQEAVNHPSIDLADAQSRLAIQVTTERKAAKVTETLTKFIARRYHSRYDRLIFFILTGDELHYAPRSKQRWQKICGRKLCFDPGSDIITTLGLFPLIQALPQLDIYALHNIIAQSVIGEDYVDVESYLTRQSRRQIDYEKKSGKYIPDIFIETRETKNLARSFAHPVLFFRRTLDSLGRINLPGSNRILAKAGLPLLPLPHLAAYDLKDTLADVAPASARLSTELAKVTALLHEYEHVSPKTPPPFPIKKDREPFYEQNTFTLESLGWSLNRRPKDRLNELAVTQARVFILTGRAGQGKTNLVCDFVENFLWKHDIPCAYLSGRRVSAMRAVELGDVIQRLIFEGKTSSFTEAARLLSVHANRNNKPFVLIIDGLNEHHRISEFAEQLEHFIETVIEHPHLKLFLTCRSEYFQQRFGNLVKGPLAGHTFLLEANEHRLEKERYDEMVAGYFKFFGVRHNMVSEQVIKSLKKDMLLLRFFCEAYGARGKTADYQQPRIANIYREQIFRMYLERKLGTADLFLQRVTGRVKPINPKADLIAVLEHAVEHMLKTWQFSNVPVSVFQSGLNDALFALLDEELILRRDAPPGPSIFSPSAETINFTFDDFRDFMLAQYLLYRVYATDRATFDRYIAQNDPKDSQIIEGIKKFLFYASRHTDNEEFWKFYRGQPWYKDVYDYEVFNIDTTLLRTDDRDVIVEALQAGGERARTFARWLAVRWHPSHDPLLNLDLLFSFVTQSDDMHFDDLVMATFKTIPHFNDGSSASAFCEFITKSVLPTFKPAPKNPENGLFRFLILLLPVDSRADLNSESDLVFRKLLDLHPAYAIGLLREALQYKPTQHRPHVWRLLALASTPLSPGDPLLAEAQQERARTAATDLVLHREVSRFLDRFGPSATIIKP